jgi:hypothetical protein
MSEVIITDGPYLVILNGEQDKTTLGLFQEGLLTCHTGSVNWNV